MWISRMRNSGWGSESENIVPATNVPRNWSENNLPNWILQNMLNKVVSEMILDFFLFVSFGCFFFVFGFFFFVFFVFFFLAFLGLYSWHMEVPRLGTYTTAHSNTESLAHWTRPVTSRFLDGFVNHCATTGTPDTRV